MHILHQCHAWGIYVSCMAGYFRWSCPRCSSIHCGLYSTSYNKENKVSLCLYVFYTWWKLSQVQREQPSVTFVQAQCHRTSWPFIQKGCFCTSSHLWVFRGVVCRRCYVTSCRACCWYIGWNSCSDEVHHTEHIQCVSWSTCFAAIWSRSCFGWTCWHRPFQVHGGQCHFFLWNYFRTWWVCAMCWSTVVYNDILDVQEIVQGWGETQYFPAWRILLRRHYVFVLLQLGQARSFLHGLILLC